MSEMKDMIIDVAERMLKENVSKDVVDLLERGDWARGIWALFEESGMFSVAISEVNGGAGGDLEDLLNIVRLTGKYAAPMPYAESTFANFLLENSKQSVVDGIATYSLKKGLILQDGEISGTLPNVRWARFSKYLVAAADSFQGTQIVLIDMKDATIEQSSNIASEPRDAVILDKVKPLSSAVITDEQFFNALSIETAFKIALMTGAIERIFDITVEYSKKGSSLDAPFTASNWCRSISPNWPERRLLRSPLLTTFVPLYNQKIFCMRSPLPASVSRMPSQPSLHLPTKFMRRLG